ncbi:hypothetical protein E2C01_053125 [Portunus trituberculatus]|uniref:Uncharacterized protein n=1 Tax=Portunus trituberculatus TaxID=210409 RepID=A0A5B7GFK8_PORTR|nr:hypothetical protein [Portunus trituberculatus]
MLILQVNRRRRRRRRKLGISASQ